MARGSAAEFPERIEEMIVAAFAARGNEAAHREGVDQRVVEMLIVVGMFGGNFALAARRRRSGIGRSFCDDECQLRGVHAEIVFGGGADEGFGVNGAGEMDMQIGAFGHFEKPRAKSERICARDFEAARGAGFE